MRKYNKIDRKTSASSSSCQNLRAAQLGTLGGKDLRPYLASECEDLKGCERSRREILREIPKKVTQIQNGNCDELRKGMFPVNCIIRHKNID